MSQDKGIPYNDRPMTRQPKCPKEDRHLTYSPTMALYKKETVSTHPHKTSMKTAAIVCRECAAIYLKTDNGWKVYTQLGGEAVFRTTQAVLLRTKTT